MILYYVKVAMVQIARTWAAKWVHLRNRYGERQTTKIGFTYDAMSMTQLGMNAALSDEFIW